METLLLDRRIGLEQRRAAFRWFIRQWRKTASAEEKDRHRAAQRYFKERLNGHDSLAGEWVPFVRDFVKERI